MTSEKKIQANRRNAQLSTGPRTPQGKANSSRNALKHGFTSSEVFLPGENPEEFQETLQTWRSEIQPACPFEESLVLELAAADWRLQRVLRLEVAFLNDSLAEVRRESGLPNPAPRPSSPPSDDAYHEGSSLLARAFQRSCAVHNFMQLVRHDATNRRAFYRAMDSLNRFRARRAVAPPQQQIAERSAPAPSAGQPRT